MHILLTRPLDDCKELILKFKQLGHKVSHLPVIKVESKKYINNAKMMYQIFSPQRGEILSNGVLKIYGGMVRGITAACSKKDSKVGGKRLLQLWNRLTT